MRIRAFVAAVAMLPSLASAAKPVHLALTSPWVIDYAKDSCRLIGHFGTGRDEITLAFESEAPGTVDMLVAGKPLVTGAYEVVARFVPVQSKWMSGLAGVSPRSYVPMLLFSSIYFLSDDGMAALAREYASRAAHPEIRPPAISIAEQAIRKAQRQTFAGATTAIEIGVSRDKTVILETGPLDEAITTFDKCTRDSLRDWGVDPEVQDRIVRPVWSANPTAWWNPKDYPSDMLVLGRISDVKVRALVDATGRVTKCTSLSHFKDEVFNMVVCDKFLAKAHFEPAELADGTKVPSYYVNKVMFRIAE